LIIRRGDIFYADLSPVIGSEQGGVRPVLIIQNDIANKYAPTTIIAAITSQITRATLPTHIDLDAKKYNMAKDSVILFEQIRTIDKKRLKERIAHVDEDLLKQITSAYLVAGGVIDYSLDEKEKVNSFYKFRLDEKVDFIEDYDCEFKEIRGPDPNNSINSTISEYTASFLNGRGGRLYFGIANDRVVKGVLINKDKVDEINRTIYSNLASIQPPISPNFFDIIYHPVVDKYNKPIENLYIIEIVIPLSPDKKTIYFVKGNELHVRVKGVKKKLIGTEISSYIIGKYSSLEDE